MPEAQNAPDRPLLLIADDEPFVLEVLYEAAADAGWEVRTTRDGHQLGDLAAAEPHAAAILLDVRMRGPGAEPLLRTLRRTHPAARLVLMSGDPLALPLRGADAVLAKPFSLDELLDALATPHPAAAAA